MLLKMINATAVRYCSGAADIWADADLAVQSIAAVDF